MCDYLDRFRKRSGFAIPGREAFKAEPLQDTQNPVVRRSYETPISAGLRLKVERQVLKVSEASHALFHFHAE